MITILLFSALATAQPAIDPLTPTQKAAFTGYCVGFGTGMALLGASLIPYERAAALQGQLEDPSTNFGNESAFNAARDRYGRNRTAFYAMFGTGLGLVVVSPIPIIVTLEVEKDQKSLSLSGRF